MEFTSNDKVLERRQRDFDDLQHEVVGRDVGKIARFLSGDDDRSSEAKRRKREKEAEHRRLAELLTNPIYKATYQQLGSVLSTAETDTDQTIQRYEIAIQATQSELSDMEAEAARGPDGQPVFRYADGRVVDEHNRELPPEIAAGITWPPDAPPAEDYFAAKDRLEALKAELDQWRVYRTDTLGSIRDRYDNDDDPMSLDEMDDALKRIEESRPESLALEEVSPTAAAVSVDPTPTSFPQIGS